MDFYAKILARESDMDTRYPCFRGYYDVYVDWPMMCDMQLDFFLDPLMCEACLAEEIQMLYCVTDPNRDRPS